MTPKRQPDDRPTHDMGTSMRVYRWAWLLVCATLVAVGVTVVLFMSAAVLVFLFLSFAAVGVVLTLAEAGEASAAQMSRARRVVSGGLLAGTLAPAYVGLAVVLSAGVFLMVLLFAASSPYAVSAYARWMRGDSTSPAAPKVPPAARAPRFSASAPGWAPPPRSPELSRLSIEDLCQAWCASYLLLMERSAGTTTNALIATVQERQSYLDELERRNAAGLAAWLASGARVASNPLPYFGRDRVDRAAINWDDLT